MGVVHPRDAEAQGAHAEAAEGGDFAIEGFGLEGEGFFARAGEVCSLIGVTCPGCDRRDWSLLRALRYWFLSEHTLSISFVKL